MSATDELARLAAEFPGWHIWRGRSASGREIDWRATAEKRVNGRREKLAAPDAAGLRVLLETAKAVAA